MKKIAFLMLAFVATISMTACNESESDYATEVAYAWVTGTTPQITFMTDDNTQLILSDASVVGTYTPDFGQRVLIYYKRLQSAETGAETNYIKLFGYYHFTDGDTVSVATAADNNYGDVDIDIWCPDNNYYLVHTTRRVLDVAVVFPGTESGITDHTLTLVLDKENPFNEDNYLQLTLAHSTTEAEAKEADVATLYTFDLNYFGNMTNQADGICIHVPGINSEKTISHSFAWPELK